MLVDGWPKSIAGRRGSRRTNDSPHREISYAETPMLLAKSFSIITGLTYKDIVIPIGTTARVTVQKRDRENQALPRISPDDSIPRETTLSPIPARTPARFRLMPKSQIGSLPDSEWAHAGFRTRQLLASMSGIAH